MRSFKHCDSQITGSDTIAIIAHISPDADALCSMVALKKIIKSCIPGGDKKIVDLFVDCDEISPIYRPILKGEEINNPSVETYDLAICVDCATFQRVGKYQELFNKAKDTLNIDHHATNENFANNNLVLKASSTCEALYTLNEIAERSLPDDVCKLIYAGILTDTNNLTQGTITIRTHKVIAALIARRLDLEAIKSHFFQSNSLSKTLLFQKALQTLEFHAGGRIAFMKLTKKDFTDTESNFDDTLGIVNHGLDIKGVDIAIIAIKKDDGSYYVSMRSQFDINIGEIAKQMGGGGHENMAAFTISENLTEFKDTLLHLCKEELKDHPVIDNDDDLFSSTPTNN